MVFKEAEMLDLVFSIDLAVATSKYVHGNDAPNFEVLEPHLNICSEARISVNGSRNIFPSP